MDYRFKGYDHKDYDHHDSRHSYHQHEDYDYKDYDHHDKNKYHKDCHDKDYDWDRKDNDHNKRKKKDYGKKDDYWKDYDHKDYDYYDFESEDYGHKDHYDDDKCDCGKCEHGRKCVCEKVREINKAQKKVSKKAQSCEVSCDRSIKELLGHDKPSEFDTIPFKLLCGCKGDCEAFVGSGVVKINGCFYDIRSAFFRVSDFVKGSKCCAILELLCPERCEGKQHGIQGFIRTGACFEVDLSEFTGITCFPPVKGKKMDPKKFVG